MLVSSYNSSLCVCFNLINFRLVWVCGLRALLFGFCISALDHGLLGVIVFVVIVVMFYIVLL